ncbi:MAG: hypothetical protein IMZ62_15945 [Chloroflexi bacterium]|nr:hypothetical protein [Chloroflexota bacterium]
MRPALPESYEEELHRVDAKISRDLRSISEHAPTADASDPPGILTCQELTHAHVNPAPPAPGEEERKEMLEHLDGLDFENACPKCQKIRALIQAPNGVSVTEKEIEALGETVKTGENEFGPMHSLMIRPWKIYLLFREKGIEVKS